MHGAHSPRLVASYNRPSQEPGVPGSNFNSPEKLTPVDEPWRQQEEKVGRAGHVEISVAVARRIMDDGSIQCRVDKILTASRTMTTGHLGLVLPKPPAWYQLGVMQSRLFCRAHWLAQSVAGDSELGAWRASLLISTQSLGAQPRESPLLTDTYEWLAFPTAIEDVTAPKRWKGNFSLFPASRRAHLISRSCHIPSPPSPLARARGNSRSSGDGQGRLGRIGEVDKTEWCPLLAAENTYIRTVYNQQFTDATAAPSLPPLPALP